MTAPIAAPPSGPTSAPQSLNLKVLLEEVIEKNASDLHITAGERPKLRVDGDIVSSKIEYVMQPKDTMQLAYSVLTENQKKRFEMEDELDFSFGIQNLARFRGNCFKQRGCVSMDPADPVQHQELRGRPQVRAASGPRRRAHRRNARSRNDRGRPHDRGNGPLVLRDAAYELSRGSH